MGTLADSLFNVLMGWVRALVNAIWALFTTDHTTLLEFLGKNWVLIVVVILAAGLAIDWLVWLIRWQPYHLWARRARRFLRHARAGGGGRKRKKRAESGDANAENARRPMRRRMQDALGRAKKNSGCRSSSRRWTSGRRRRSCSARRACRTRSWARTPA